MAREVLPLLVVIAGLVTAAVVTAAARAPIEGLRILLDFLLAAGLLRLSSAEGWKVLAVAGLTVVVRQLVGRGLFRARRARLPLAPPARAGGSRADQVHAR